MKKKGNRKHRGHHTHSSAGKIGSKNLRVVCGNAVSTIRLSTEELRYLDVALEV